MVDYMKVSDKYNSETQNKLDILQEITEDDEDDESEEKTRKNIFMKIENDTDNNNYVDVSKLQI